MKITKTPLIASTLATAALLAPSSALASQPATWTYAASCKNIEAKLAPQLTDAEEVQVATACAVRDAAVTPARDARAAAQETLAKARIAANQAYVAAVKAAQALPQGEARRAAMIKARKDRRVALHNARVAYNTVAAESRKAIHSARVTFRVLVDSLLTN